MWTQTHAPHALIEVVGNSDLVTEIRHWANAWNQNDALGGKGTGIPKPLLLVGPPGVGKTAVAYALSEEFGWSLVEFNASDTRNQEVIGKVVSSAALNASFSGGKRLILLDEVDGVKGSGDKGGLPAILSVLKEARNPILLTANDIYADKRLASIRSYCKVLSFKKVAYPSIAKFLREVAEKEGIDYDMVSLNALAKNASGDMRASLNDFESIARATKKVTLDDVNALGYRERSENVFNVMRSLFVSTSFKEIRRMRASAEVDHSLLKKWVEENIPRQFPMVESLAPAFDQLSRADMFDGRIFRRQHYGFLKYSGDLSASVSLATHERAHGWISYQFPAILKRLSLMKNSSKKSVIQKIQSHVFGSRNRIGKELPYWSAIFEGEKDVVPFIQLFKFDEDDLAFLLHTNATSARVKKLMKQAAGEASESVEKRPKKKASEKKKPAETNADEKMPGKKTREKNSSLILEKNNPDDSVPNVPTKLEEKDVPNQTSLSRFFS